MFKLGLHVVTNVITTDGILLELYTYFGGTGVTDLAATYVRGTPSSCVYAFYRNGALEIGCCRALPLATPSTSRWCSDKTQRFTWYVPDAFVTVKTCVIAPTGCLRFQRTCVIYAAQTFPFGCRMYACSFFSAWIRSASRLR